MAEAVNGSAPSPSLFQYFLSKLVEEHQREVCDLQTQISELARSVHDSSGAEVSGLLTRPLLSVSPQQSWLNTSSASGGNPDLVDSRKETGEHSSGFHDFLPVESICRDSCSSFAPLTNMGSLITPMRSEEWTPSPMQLPVGSPPLPQAASGNAPLPPARPSEGSTIYIPQHSSNHSIGLCLQDERFLAVNVLETMQGKRLTGCMTRLCANFKLAGASNEVITEAYFHAWSQLTKRLRTAIAFKLRQSWVECLIDPSVTRGAKSKFNRMATAASKMTEASQMTDVEQAQLEHAGRFMISPNSSTRIFWDLAGGILLLYDLFSIPIMVFDPPASQFTDTMAWVTTIFWTLDMGASCVTGYCSHGNTVMEPRSILWNYFRGWLFLDIVVVVPDWIATIMDAGGSDSTGGTGGSAGSMLRALRVLRIARLLRLAKLQRAVAVIKDLIQSESTFIVIQVLKLIVMMLMINHMLACVWYQIGISSEPSWIDAGGFGDASLAYRYTTSMHWSLTQFTPASMEVQPQCVAERIFAISCLVFGLVLFSSIVGRITASMTQLRGMGEEKSEQLWLLRRFLRQRGIKPDLVFRVMRYVEYALNKKKDLICDQRIWVLSHLSDQLRDELQFEVSFSSMAAHPLFYRITFISDDMMSRLTGQGLSQQSLAPGDLLFSAGSFATHMQMLVTGEFHYMKAEDMKLEDAPREQFVSGDWACESALWISWTCVGTSRTTLESTFVQIEAEAFGKAIHKDVHVWNLASHYAVNYLKWINETPLGALTDAFGNDEMLAVVDEFVGNYGLEVEEQGASSSSAARVGKAGAGFVRRIRRASVLWSTAPSGRRASTMSGHSRASILSRVRSSGRSSTGSGNLKRMPAIRSSGESMNSATSNHSSHRSREHQDSWASPTPSAEPGKTIPSVGRVHSDQSKESR